MRSSFGGLYMGKNRLTSRQGRLFGKLIVVLKVYKRDFENF